MQRGVQHWWFRKLPDLSLSERNLPRNHLSQWNMGNRRKMTKGGSRSTFLWHELVLLPITEASWVTNSDMSSNLAPTQEEQMQRSIKTRQRLLKQHKGHLLEMDPWSVRQLRSLLHCIPVGGCRPCSTQGLGKARQSQANNHNPVGREYNHGLYWDKCRILICCSCPLFPSGELSPQTPPLHWLGEFLQRSHNFTDELIQWFYHGKTLLQHIWSEQCELSLLRWPHV